MSPSEPAALGPRRLRTLRTVAALVLREMSTSYGRSPGGYLWALLEPIGAIVVLTLAFSLVLRAPSLGTSFALFFATGFLPFHLYMKISNPVSRALSFSKALLRYPGVSWLDAILARFALNGLTALMVFYLVIAGILLVQDTRAILDFPPILASLALAAFLGLGVGTMNCALTGIVPVWTQIWSIVTRPLFLASGVFFIYEDMPPVAQDILWYNPLMHITGLLRTGIYSTYDAAYVSIAFVFGVSAVLLAFGLVLLGRYHRDILND